ncbi:glucose-6-phosphate isomerase [Candidatus Desulfovibrio trichonymphae]|uniref:Glucose-6-phosphate isomerase n=1 Tax=Candidatus Desulfovibrio trichonymphae TaxID=1725232 RepID=A0A1J1E4T1_9BACT|nr:glucose-6-phosphate isomerase [Candidatus Desulfovibrio trichonymphae]BAV92464.1 glucose-6-phosphate isomerase [Candidatus Desulfovibrio trichonymphae]GHU90310.1 glucose-6-phosphate isomerase [Deltaproteobacteria bacterium]GHU97544.1 glucose-6-phosphate isomerase [Deltaproteobacteria bacterium]
MPHTLEWSQAYTHRLSKNNARAVAARQADLSQRLAYETAAGALPFLTMSYREKLVVELPLVLPRLKICKHMLVLGIGGSALGARAIQRAFAPGQDGPEHQGPWLWIADNVCAQTFDAWLSKLNPAETVVVCISKSGGTIETLAQYFLACDWLKTAFGRNWTQRMIVITDKTKGYLREEALRHALISLEVPNCLGGRYSALSAVGLLPAAFLGIDWQSLLDGAADVARPLTQNPSNIGSHPAFALACWAHELEVHQYSQLVFFCYIPTWSAYGLWFAQLWAESLGKKSMGTMPVPATGVTDQHSVNQMFLDGPRNKGCLFLTSRVQAAGRNFGTDLPEQWAWLRGKAFGSLLEAESLGTRMALSESGVPLVHLEMHDTSPRAAGALMMLLEAATLFTGWLMDINPLDQPAVELGKRLANARLGATGYLQEEADLFAFLSAAKKEQHF